MNSPRVIESVSEMRKEARLARFHTHRIAFVPTMGYLHAGHVSLMEAARQTADLVVLSIFVNPIQFGPKEDLSRYPRDLSGDLGKAHAAGVDLVFTPGADEMYRPGFQTFVDVRELSQGMCGASRPGHFTGVATVVLKLLHIVEPDVAFFGEKDYQQLQVIRRMVRDLDLPVEIIGLPIVRERDGLAMSSRNAYLKPQQRSQALALSRALHAAQARFVVGERDPKALIAAAHKIIASEPGVRLDYLELRDAESLVTATTRIDRPAVLAVAAFVGATRLIDNLLLAP